MLPVPVSDAKDGRQYEYLPLYCTPSVSARTTLDSSSDDGSVNFEGEWDMDNNIQDDLTKDQYSDQSGKFILY